MQPKAPAAPGPKELGKPITPPTQITRVRLNSRLLAAACFDGKVRLWDVSGKDPVERPALGDHNGWVSSVAFGSAQLFSCDSWGKLSAWRFVGDEIKPHWSVEAAHDGWARDVAFSARDTAVATCGKDGFVRLWDRGTGKKFAEFETKTDVLSVCFAPDGKSLFAGDLFGTVREFDTVARKQTRTFELKELHKIDRVQDVGGARCLAISADGKTLLVGGGEPKTGGFVQAIPLLIALDLATGKPNSWYKGATDNEGYVTDVAWHPDGYAVFTTSGQPGQGKVHFWKVGEPKPFFTGGKHPNCHSVAISPDGATMAVSATNANSSGNGRVKGMGGEYPANSSPIQVWSVPKL